MAGPSYDYGYVRPVAPRSGPLVGQLSPDHPDLGLQSKSLILVRGPTLEAKRLSLPPKWVTPTWFSVRLPISHPKQILRIVPSVMPEIQGQLASFGLQAVLIIAIHHVHMVVHVHGLSTWSMMMKQKVVITPVST